MNNGGTGPAVDPVKAGLDQSFRGVSRQEICSADEKRDRWAKAISAAIEPPRKYGNIDMAGDDTWRGITVEQADQVNCQSVVDGDGAVHWGDNQEIQFFYDIGTHIVTQMVLNLGYGGKVKVKGRKPNSGQPCFNYTKDPPAPDDTCPHQNDSYEFGIGVLPLKNGKPWLFDPSASWDAMITEFNDAVIATYMPDQASAPSCHDNGGCLELPDDGLGNIIFGFRPAAVYFVFHAHTPQPTLSTPYYLYNFFIKILPYSNAGMTVKIDKDGPVAQQFLGPKADKNCAIQLGQTWKQMQDNCVNVNGDPTLDKQNFNKLVGGRIHTLDDIFFNVVGVNQNVTLKLGQYDYVRDDQLPGDEDQTTEWIFDVRARGALNNEIIPASSPPKSDLHGSGLFMREYVRLAQQEIYRLAGTPVASQHSIADKACLSQTPAAGCTGLEGVMLPGPALGATHNPTPPPLDGGTLEDAQMTKSFGGIYVSFLKPGDHLLFTCKNPSAAYPGFDFVGGQCDGDIVGISPPAVWDGALQNVIDVFGRGDIYRLPPAVRDRRFFFQQYTIALTKYMKAYGQYGDAVTLTQIANTVVDLENTFWDISDVNSFDKIEYVERDFVDATHEPTNFEYGSDIKVANQRTTSWDRKMSRAERAMYQSLLGSSTEPLGKNDNTNITNLFGTDVITSAVFMSGVDGRPQWNSIECATTLGCTDVEAPTCKKDTDCPAISTSQSCGGIDPATGIGGCSGTSLLEPWKGAGDFHFFQSGLGNDSDGKPLFAHYPGAWRGTIFHKGKSPIKLTGFLSNVQAAKVDLPQFSDPYDPSSQLVQMVSALVPHLPQQPGIGVNVPISGTRDRLVPTGNLDFAGNTSTYQVKYQYQTCVQEKLDLATASKACNLGSQQNYICDPGTQPALISGDAVSADGSCHASQVKRADGLDNYCCDGLARPQFITTGSKGAGQTFGALINILAIDSADFLGDVFICADPRTGDVLRARMYDSAQSMLDWFTGHPGTIDACDIVVRYSPFNNYLDKIFARKYGVSVDISKSFGAGRVDDAMLWDPALLAQ